MSDLGILPHEGSPRAVRLLTADPHRGWIAYVLLSSLLVLWAYAIRTIYLDSGLFWWVGTDFAQYYAQSNALWSGVPSNIYRPETYRELYETLLEQYIVDQQPVPPTSVPYAPIFPWLFTPLTMPPPHIGFIAWEVINVGALIYLVWRTTRLVSPQSRPLVSVLIVSSFPVIDTLLVGQPQILLAVAMGECYLALRERHDLAGGLWLACLVIKPQYGVLVGLFLLWKQRWRAVAGAACGVAIVVGVSLLITDWHTLLAYPSALREMAIFQGYWEQNMINWRSLVLAARPGVSTFKGMLLTQALSCATLAAVLFVSRGGKYPPPHLWSVQFTLLILATLLISHHSLTYGAVMLILPLASVFSDQAVSLWTRLAVIAGAILPSLSFTAWNFLHVPAAARLLTFAILLCFASLLYTAWHADQRNSAAISPAIF